MKGQLNASSLWRTDIPSRSELIAYNFGSVGPAGFFGAGLYDVTTSGSAVANYNLRVEIDGIGTPDTFRWSSDGGTTWTASGVAITGVAQTLIEYVAVTFTATTGHTLNDYWIFTAGPIKNVEQLTADGSVCSATYLTTGTITNSLGGTTACTNAPTSFDVNPNRIEDADKAYMGSGGSGGGGGGGGSHPRGLLIILLITDDPQRIAGWLADGCTLLDDSKGGIHGACYQEISWKDMRGTVARRRCAGFCNPCPGGAGCLPSGGATIKLDDTANMRINYQFQLYGAYRDTGSGKDGTEPTTDFYFRRNRLTFSGVATDKLSYILMLEQSGERKIGPVTVEDETVGELDELEAFVIFEPSKAFKINAGKMKIPFMREIMEGCFSNLSLDRSLFVYTPFQRSRDMGVALWGNLMKSKVQYIFSAMDGQESGDAPESSPRLTGRVHLALLDPEDTYGYSGTYLGNKMVFTIGAAAQYEPGAVYSDMTNEEGAKDYTALTADVFIEYPAGVSGAITLSGAYMETSFDDAYQDSDPDPESMGLDGDKKGWYAKAGYLFINKIGAGQLQPFVRYESWEFAKLGPIVGQKLTWIGGGLNYLINGQNLRLGIEYSMTDFR